MEEPLCFSNRENWGSWLSINYDKKEFAWLVFFKKSSKQKGLTLNEAVEEAIRFGWIDGKLKRLDEERFILRFSPRKVRSVWSKINKERAEQLIASGKMSPAGLVKIEEAKRTGLWDSAYTNALLDDLPDDLKEELLKNKSAWINFCGLANTYRNMYIGWVTQSKTKETRQKRIQKVVEQSTENKKQMFL
jgi:uncharacterized protein YdeI (YjbR/CyaY-like superfamily)